MRKYAVFFGLHILSVVLWAVWALPAMDESGTILDEAFWLAAQIVLPVLIFTLISRGYRPAFWIALLWGGMLLLFGAGLLGWGLMGIGTPVSVYVVAGMLLVNGLGVFSSALKDLHWIRERNPYAFED